MKSILDPSFRYTTSVNTDVRKTFARIRRDQQAMAKRHAPDGLACVNVTSIVGKSAARRG